MKGRVKKSRVMRMKIQRQIQEAFIESAIISGQLDADSEEDREPRDLMRLREISIKFFDPLKPK